MYAQFFGAEGVHVKESWKVRSVEKYKSSSQHNLPYLKYSTVQALRNRKQSLTFDCFSSTLPYTHTYCPQSNDLGPYMSPPSRQLVRRLPTRSAIRLTSTIVDILLRLVRSDLFDPSKLVLDLALLNAFELSEKLDDSGPGLVASTLVLEGVVFGLHGDALDGHECCCCACCGDFGEGSDFFVFDL